MISVCKRILPAFRFTTAKHIIPKHNGFVVTQLRISVPLLTTSSSSVSCFRHLSTPITNNNNNNNNMYRNKKQYASRQTNHFHNNKTNNKHTTPPFGTFDGIARRCFSNGVTHTHTQTQPPTEPASAATEESIYSPDPLIGKRATLSVVTRDHPGALSNALQTFTKCEVSLTRIESRYQVKATEVDFYIDVNIAHDHRRLQLVLKELEPYVVFAKIVPAMVVPWFPITIQEVDGCALLTLDGGTDLQADHPGFHDEVYKRRRAEVAGYAAEFKFGDHPHGIDYSSEEIECWNTIWEKLEPLLYKHGCPEYIESFVELQKVCGYGKGKMPQLGDVSQHLFEKTGFRLRPTAGLLSSRHFLNGLAFKTFFCTQYLRHHSCPFYTPEPDIVHELIGHAPMFANPEFASFSQEIGLASIGATDEQIDFLARCYWFSVEFGLCRAQPGSEERKIYGAGVLSSFGEIEYAMGPEPEIRPWNPFEACFQEFPITKFQPVYYLADSFVDATERMQHFANSLDRPFTCRWNDVKEKLIVDRNIKRKERNWQDFGEYVGEND